MSIVGLTGSAPVDGQSSAGDIRRAVSMTARRFAVPVAFIRGGDMNGAIIAVADGKRRRYRDYDSPRPYRSSCFLSSEVT